MFKKVKLVVLILMPIALTSCFFGIYNHKNEYLDAKTIPPATIPSDLQPATMDQKMPIPPATAPAVVQSASTAPPDALELLPVAVVDMPKKIQVAAMGVDAQGHPQLKVEGTYARVWQKTETTFTGWNYQIVGSDKSTGVIEVRTPLAYQFILQSFQPTVPGDVILISVLDQQGHALPASVSQPLLQQLQTALIS
jgi:uncharacterized lipoprotein